MRHPRYHPNRTPDLVGGKVPPTTAPQWQARCRDCVGVPTSRGKCLERATSGIFQAPLRLLARRRGQRGFQETPPDLRIVCRAAEI